jgi:hypothetical protein
VPAAAAAPDLVVVTETDLAAGVTVALVEQPYRVAGRRSPSPAPRLDEAWVAVVEQLAAGPLPKAPPTSWPLDGPQGDALSDELQSSLVLP